MGDITSSIEDGTEMYEVTVAMTGSISVRARSAHDAMLKVDGMPSELCMEQVLWDSHSATDAYPVSDLS